MALTEYKYKKGDSVFHAISEGYKQANDYCGIPGGFSGFGQYVSNNKLKIAGVVVALSVAALTAAYFMSPAYAAFVNIAGAKVATFVSPAIAELSTFAAAHPLIASLIVVTSVVALIAASVFAYKKSDKADRIEKTSELLEKGSPSDTIGEAKLARLGGQVRTAD